MSDTGIPLEMWIFTSNWELKGSDPDDKTMNHINEIIAQADWDHRVIASGVPEVYEVLS